MKIVAYSLAVVLFIGGFASCKKDNYAPPSSQLSGALMYNGDSIGVEYNQVSYQLYQYGFGKVGAIDGTFRQDGSLEALLFDGDYKFIIPNGQGPFMWKQNAQGNPDSLDIKMNGSQNVAIEVTPYYMIRNAQISGNSSKVTATFKAEKIITDANAKDIERVVLFINKTPFVSGADNIANSTVEGADITDANNIALNVDVPSNIGQSYVFARVGLKIAGIEDMIFSSVQKISY